MHQYPFRYCRYDFRKKIKQLVHQTKSRKLLEDAQTTEAKFNNREAQVQCVYIGIDMPFVNRRNARINWSNSEALESLNSSLQLRGLNVTP